MVDSVYEGFAGAVSGPMAEKLEYFADRAVITPTNEAAAALNSAILDALPGEATEFLSRVSIQAGKAGAAHYPVRPLN